VDPQLQTLIDLQAFDARIAALEGDAARVPGQIEAIHAVLAEAKQTLDTLKARADTTRKDLRVKEKDLEVVTAKRAKSEARLWEVKNNTEYSAVLAEIETIKQEKAQGEEEILALMELQERLAVDVREAEARFTAREEQARRDEAAVEHFAVDGSERQDRPRQALLDQLLQHAIFARIIQKARIFFEISIHIFRIYVIALWFFY